MGSVGFCEIRKRCFTFSWVYGVAEAVMCGLWRGSRFFHVTLYVSPCAGGACLRQCCLNVDFGQSLICQLFAS